MPRNRKDKPDKLIEVEVVSIDLEGQGVGHLDGKVVFVTGALAGELVQAKVLREKPSFMKAEVTKVIKESSLRVKPKCPNFGTCGGCAVQHLDAGAQVAVKSRALEDLLERIGKTKPENVLVPLHGPYWGYRHRARLTCRFVHKKNKMLVGFRERSSSYVADMQECHVLPPRISRLLPQLAEFMPTLSIFERLPQIELALGDPVLALVLRHLEPLTEADLIKLSEFGRLHDIEWWLQPKGPETAHRLGPMVHELSYEIASYGIRMKFRPTDFTQVNHQINDAMIVRALQLLEPRAQDRILDLFCGLGNFTLPLAKTGSFVKAFEGAQDLVDRALENAKSNGLDHKTEFHVRNLFEVTRSEWEQWGVYDKVLIDPPRDGALEVCKSIASASPEFQPEKIVYVSCNPATLARDTSILCQTGPYRLKKAGVINMFPHTSHVESIALFEKAPQV